MIVSIQIVSDKDLGLPMPGLLKGIQSQLNKYAQILNSILEVDVEIVDVDFIRISGTGIYQDMLDVDTRDEGHVYASVFDSKSDRIVLDILHHPICSRCDRKTFCANKLIIAVPIMFAGRAVGTIGIISTEEEKKKYIQDRLHQFLEFVHHISDLITSKLNESQAQLRERRQREMWMGIVDVIDDGVAILRREGELVYANAIGRDLLHLPAESERVTISVARVQEESGNYDRLLLNINESQVTVIGRMVAIEDLAGGFDRLIIIRRLVPLEDEEPGEPGTRQLMGESEPIKRLHEVIRRVARSPSTVLISGESGTGKELVAQEIHRMSDRRERPFVAVNCGAIPEPLLESELFGYVKGAFTGANLAGKVGKFELANSGILFLDEIGDIPLSLQVKLLRVLQEKKLYRVGSNQVIDLNLKIIAATNKDLEELCERGLFRRDLYYRLNVIQIEMPPIRERKDDIVPLFRYFVEKFSREFGVRRIQIAPETESCVTGYNWTGNVRELENAVEYAMNFVSDGEIITPDLLPARICRKSGGDISPAGKRSIFGELIPGDGVMTLEQLNREYLQALLDKFGPSTESKKNIAKQLGISSATLYRMLK